MARSRAQPPHLPADIEHIHLADPATPFDLGPVAVPSCDVRLQQGCRVQGLDCVGDRVARSLVAGTTLLSKRVSSKSNDTAFGRRTPCVWRTLGSQSAPKGPALGDGPATRSDCCRGSELEPRTHPALSGRTDRSSDCIRRDCGMSAFADLPREPLSDCYGLDRGTPVDRRYIEAFVCARRDAIHGRVLEVQDNTYTTRFGADRVAESVVVDIDAGNPRATLIADLEQVGSLPRESYDCIILTQTLHLLRRPDRCIDNCFAALRARGVLLATAPSVSRVSPTYPHGDFWRFTPAGITEVFTRHWPSDFTVHAFGSLRTCVAFLLGEAQEDLPGAVLDYNDSRFPLTVAVDAQKTST
jgi:hypothetical protein